MRRRFWRADTIAVGMMTLVALAVFGAVLAHALWYAPEPDGLAPAGVPAGPGASAEPAGAPARLAIPALGIDARVQQVGLSPKGAIGIPDNFTDVAWYRFGAAPGERGTAIIDGHVDNGLALAGVFKHLIDISAGDDIVVTGENGERIRFVVYDVESYPYQQVPIERILAARDDAELALISCDGGWVQGAHTYDHRLVVYAKEAS